MEPLIALVAHVAKGRTYRLEPRVSTQITNFRLMDRSPFFNFLGTMPGACYPEVLHTFTVTSREKKRTFSGFFIFNAFLPKVGDADLFYVSSSRLLRRFYFYAPNAVRFYTLLFCR